MAKLRWRCRRGMRELDALMLAWLDNHHQHADEATRTKFADLLAMQDPDIMTLLNKFDGPEVHSANTNPTGSKDSSFESIIRQARRAATTVAAQNIHKTTGPSKKQGET